MDTHLATSLAYLADMIRIDSRNTLALRAPGQREADEEEMADYLSAKLGALGFALERQYLAPRRPNLIARRHLADGLPTLAFNAHMDTVGSSGMSIDPFDPQCRDGRIYGRGACDTKGSLAAMLTACQDIIAAQTPINLLYIATSAEETGCQGAAELRLENDVIDGVIVGEPTRNQVVVAHKCHATIALSCHGKAAHASNPQLGDNAIYKAGRLLNYLQAVSIPELAKIKDEIFPEGCTLSVGIIAGGVKNNIVAESCQLICDFRLLPSIAAPEEFLAEWSARTAAALSFPLDFQALEISPAMSYCADNPLVHSIRKVLRRRGLDDSPRGVAYCTDGGHLSAMGLPCVVMGPGDIAVAHSAVEYLELAQLQQASHLYLDIAQEFAQQGPRH
jgi:acetylornithine deacetylase/succinyl-diaminopimelate desuccinylase-like protein